MAHFDYYATNGFDERVDDEFFAMLTDYCRDVLADGALISRGAETFDEEIDGAEKVFVYLDDDAFSTSTEQLVEFLFGLDEEAETEFEYRVREHYERMTNHDWPTDAVNGLSVDLGAMYDAIEEALFDEEINIIHAPNAAFWIRKITNRTFEGYCGNLYDEFVRDHNTISAKFFCRVSPYQMTDAGIEDIVGDAHDRFWEALPCVKSQLSWLEEFDRVQEALKREMDGVNWQFDEDARCYH